jgi:hypothetical protein
MSLLDFSTKTENVGLKSTVSTPYHNALRPVKKIREFSVAIRLVSSRKTLPGVEPG